MVIKRVDTFEILNASSDKKALLDISMKLQKLGSLQTIMEQNAL